MTSPPVATLGPSALGRSAPRPPLSTRDRRTLLAVAPLSAVAAACFYRFTLLAWVGGRAGVVLAAAVSLLLHAAVLMNALGARPDAAPSEQRGAVDTED